MSHHKTPIFPWFQGHNSAQLDFIDGLTDYDPDFNNVTVDLYCDPFINSLRGIPNEKIRRRITKILSSWPGKGDLMKVTPFVIHFGWLHQKQPFYNFADRVWAQLVADPSLLCGWFIYFGVYLRILPFNLILPPSTTPMKHTYDSIQVGDTFSSTRFISMDDVQLFADVTGDDNPIHLDEEYAKNSIFGERVVHGVLSLGVMSKVLGKDYPGIGSIAVAISIQFLRPVPVNSEIRVDIKVMEKIEKRKHVRMRCTIYRNNKIAMRGEATVIPPPADA